MTDFVTRDGAPRTTPPGPSSAANVPYLVKLIRRALEDHAPPKGGAPGCTFCQGALAALEQLEADRDR